MGTDGVFVVAKQALFELKNIQMNNSSTTYEKDGFKYRDEACTNLYNDYQGSYMQAKMNEYYEKELVPRYKDYIIPTTKQDSAYVVDDQDAVSAGTVATYTKDKSNANYKGTSLNNDYIFPMSVEEVITYYSSLEARKVTIFHESGEVISALRSPLILKIKIFL